ncbi:Uncharacterized conserved protein [Pseudomonas guariconensis]|uniref:MORN repeat-containing protein n=1 Tax=Pseudomonas guariconensis TaxID=1288410 RepID=UPI00087FC675|nr:hypothetical protein [Pseudomonas guariconensis]SDC65046.1 Uncharacterized conserved protein [Pseudomonas guariconensis]
MKHTEIKNHKIITIAFTLAISNLVHQQSYAKDLYTSNRCLVSKAVNLENSPPAGLILTWTGACLNNFIDGKGLLTAKKGNHVIFTYEGYVLAGELSGRGSIQWPALNTSYTGEFASGGINGRGVYRYDDGGIYEGDLQKGEPEGHGKMTWPDQSYEGEWKNGLINGKGVYRFPDGRVYEGYMVNGKLNGQGIMRWPGGKESYQGEWKNDKMNGKGTYKFADGRIYVGNLKNDSFAGPGELTWKDGSSYTGNFKNDEPHGNGILRTPDGETKKVHYTNGKLSAQNSSKEPNKPNPKFSNSLGQRCPWSIDISDIMGRPYYEGYINTSNSYQRKGHIQSLAEWKEAIRYAFSIAEQTYRTYFSKGNLTEEESRTLEISKRSSETLGCWLMNADDIFEEYCSFLMTYNGPTDKRVGGFIFPEDQPCDLRKAHSSAVRAKWKQENDFIQDIIRP